MKTRCKFVILSILFLTPRTQLANPILEGYFNELKFNSGSWILEIHAIQSIALDGWYLKSRSGTAYFKSGIPLGGRYVLITRDSMLTPLSINQLEDSLTLHSPQSQRAQLTWSDRRDAMISAPLHGESICLKENDIFYYLDKSPTLGQPNDASNAFGRLRGTVRNASGNPVSSVQVWYEQWPGRYVFTDSVGQFEFSDFARLERLQLVHPDYATRTQQVQVWPDSTVNIILTLERLVTVVYPLHIGDRWNWGLEKKITGDTLMPNGKRYMKMLDPTYIQHPYQRYEANRVYAYQFRGNIDQMVYDFSKSSRDTIATIYRPSDTTDIILAWYGETTLFGRARRQWGFWFDTRRMIDEELYHVITDSIGVTHEEGMWFSADLLGASINGIVYGIISNADEHGEQLPTKFKLYENYPNPFNPVTTIEYDLPRAGFVTLKVFNMLGEETRTLVNETNEAGRHRVQFDAGALPSGVYLYRLQEGTFTETRKLIVIK